ncbi:flagellar assembly protein FliW [Solibacillus sp. FSL R7-0668]|uniref:flagellar assembly protein FliW n=1 Tax=Solibacillus sp. FSL R7-0668 TaxID=2921688 RepID=UPI0030F7259B
MKVETKLLGEVEVQESDVVTFEQGLLGLQDLKKYTLLPIEQDLPFLLLQSLDDAEVSFVLAYPYAFKPDYTFEISDEDRELLKIEAEMEVVTYAIVTMNDSWATSTMNLLAPVVINVKEKLAKQIVLQTSEAYSLRHPIGTSEGSGK